MPIHEYECIDCGHFHDEFLSMRDTPKERMTCTECKGTLIKKISSGGFILKGPGFHCNDYDND